MRNYEGFNYHKIKNKYGSEIVAILKTEIKQWVADYNKANKTKYTVSIKKNRGGWTTSMNFTIKSKDNYFEPVATNSPSFGVKFNTNYENFKKQLNYFITSFNYDKSDIMTDYFDVKFYSYITNCMKQEHTYAEQLKTELYKTIYE